MAAATEISPPLDPDKTIPMPMVTPAKSTKVLLLNVCSFDKNSANQALNFLFWLEIFFLLFFLSESPAA